MLFPSDATSRRIRETLRKMRSEAAPVTGRKLLEIDPEYGMAYLLMGQHAADRGDLDEAEALLREGLELEPAAAVPYLFLADTLRRRNPDDPMYSWYLRLGLRKLAYSGHVPESVAGLFEEHLGTATEADMRDPSTYEAMAAAMDRPEDPLEAIDETLRPYVWLTDLQEQAPGEMTARLLENIRENAVLCAPVFHNALKEWGRRASALTPRAVELLAAILGEIGAPEVLPHLVELSQLSTENIFLHAHWAVCRMAQRYPAEAVAVFRSMANGARTGLLCGLAEQLALMGDRPGVKDALLELLEGFSKRASDEDAPYLLLVVADAIADLGFEKEAGHLIGGYGEFLPRKAQKWVLKIIESEDGFIPKLSEEGLPEITIEEVCLERIFMDREEGEDDEETGDEFESEIDDEFAEEIEQVAQRVAAPKPGRNDPCWCGSGKKYKKCHLEADERGEREPADGEPEEEPLPPETALLLEVLSAAREWNTREDETEARRLYFENPDDAKLDDARSIPFLQWYAYDFRPPSHGKTAVEEFLNRRAGQISGPQREMLEAWRDSVYGLFEVERVDAGRGVILRDVYSEQRYYVSDVSSSRELVRWDIVLNRIEPKGSRYEFSGNGILVPRNLFDRVRDWIEKERALTGQTGEEFVRTSAHRMARVLEEMGRQFVNDLKVVNKEGDPLEICAAVYEVADEKRALQALRRAPDVEGPKDSPGTLKWLEASECDPRSVLATLRFQRGRLWLETNSRKRLERGKELIAKHAGAYVKHLGDSHTSMEEIKRGALSGQRKPDPASIPPESERQLIMEFKTKHYANWADEPLGALDGETPRQAVATAEGRNRVLHLLHLFENGEERGRRDGRAAFDFSGIRADLGFTPDE